MELQSADALGVPTQDALPSQMAHCGFFQGDVPFNGLAVGAVLTISTGTGFSPPTVKLSPGADLITSWAVAVSVRNPFRGCFSTRLERIAGQAMLAALKVPNLAVHLNFGGEVISAPQTDFHGSLLKNRRQ